ncbi:MAG: hypothetical protein QM528_05125 [Phycisphaerales bacterium]|nr:hypothetical protein [Phycisphaerales bacterium]
MDIFIGAFELFHLYSTSLSEHLRGFNIQCNGYTGPNIYLFVLILFFIVNTAIVINYYYGLFNHPKFTKRINWAFGVLLSSLIMFAIAWNYPYQDIQNHQVCKTLLPNISGWDCFGFGLTAFIWSLIYCTALSFFIKSGSTSNKRIPF